MEECSQHICNNRYTQSSMEVMPHNTELQIREGGGIKDNLKMIFLMSQ